MTHFHGMHTHALTNMVYHFEGELTQKGNDLVEWHATVSRQGHRLEPLSGTTAFDPATSSGLQAAMAEIETRIDAQDWETVKPLA